MYVNTCTSIRLKCNFFTSMIRLFISSHHINFYHIISLYQIFLISPSYILICSIKNTEIKVTVMSLYFCFIHIWVLLWKSHYVFMYVLMSYSCFTSDLLKSDHFMLCSSYHYIMWQHITSCDIVLVYVILPYIILLFNVVLCYVKSHHTNTLCFIIFKKYVYSITIYASSKSNKN